MNRGGGGRKGGGGTGLEIVIKEGFSEKGTFVQRLACCAVNHKAMSVCSRRWQQWIGRP